jgi:two-component system, NtrC family, sensor kinase
MRVGTRLCLWLIIPLVAVTALFAYLDQRRSRALLEEELAREGRAVAHTARLAIEDYLRDRQIDDLRGLVESLSGYENILGMRVSDAAGAPIYQSKALRRGTCDTAAAVHRALTELKPLDTRCDVAGDAVVSHVMPLVDPQGELRGVVEVLRLEPFVDEDARASRNVSLALTLVMIVLTATIVLVVTRWTVGRSVDDLVRSFRRVGSGDMHSPVPVRHEDEFGHLAHEFNGMCARLARSQHALRQAEQLAALGRMAAGLAHEIGTPLAVIGGRAETLLRKLGGSPPAERDLRIMKGQIDRITRIVHAFLDFGATRPPAFARTDVRRVLLEVLELVEQRLDDAHVRVATTLDPELPTLSADRDRLHELFLNLALNAADAMDGGGTLHVACAVAERVHPDGGAPQACLEIVFTDSGAGIPPESLDRVFEPFFTTKEVGRGTGLGLSISYGIAREHGGWLSVASEVGQGSRFGVHLPLEPAAVVRGAA